MYVSEMSGLIKKLQEVSSQIYRLTLAPTPPGGIEVFSHPDKQGDVRIKEKGETIVFHLGNTQIFVHKSEIESTSYSDKDINVVMRNGSKLIIFFD